MSFGAYQAQRAGHEDLDDGPAVVVEEMHLIDDQQANQRCHGLVATLAGDHIPLLWGCHDHLRCS